MTYTEHIQAERFKLRQFFSKKELRSKAARNPITKASLIQRHQQLHFKERYSFGVPQTVIQPNQIVAIIQNLK